MKRAQSRGGSRARVAVMSVSIDAFAPAEPHCNQLITSFDHLTLNTTFPWHSLRLKKELATFLAEVSVFVNSPCNIFSTLPCIN